MGLYESQSYSDWQKNKKNLMTLSLKKTLLKSKFMTVAEKSTFSILQNPAMPKFRGLGANMRLPVNFEKRP